MMYSFTQKCNKKDALAIWKFIQNGLSKDVTIKSIKDKLPYTVHYINNTAISFSALTRNNGEPEIINFEDFQYVINNLKTIGIFNTNSAKECFKGSRILQETLSLFCFIAVKWSN